jgi:hypothetical protein
MKSCIKCSKSSLSVEFPKKGNICKKCVKEYKRKYNLEKKDKYKKDSEKRKEYYSTPEWKEYRKKYREENKEKLKHQKQEWSKKNRHRINESQKLWRDLNKEDVYKKRNEYVRKRKEDPVYKLICNIGTLIKVSIIRNGFTKRSKTNEILGCSFEDFKLYLESKFYENMTWENHGTYWHLDHIVPISWAKDENDVIKLNHYTNFQPLKAFENQSKGNRYSG